MIDRYTRLCENVEGRLVEEEYIGGHTMGGG